MSKEFDGYSLLDGYSPLEGCLRGFRSESRAREVCSNWPKLEMGYFEVNLDGVARGN